MKPVLSCCLALAIAAHAAHAAEATPPELATLFPENVPRALVVVVPPSPGSRSLEDRVGGLLHDSGRVGRVVPSSVLGTFSGLDEATVTARALRLAIDTVVLVKALDGGATELTAVYRDNTRRGPTLLPPRSDETSAPASSATSPPERVAAPSEPATAPPAPPRRSQAELHAEYDETSIRFHEGKSIRKTEPFQGVYMRPLDWPEFYDTVERSDLADEARTRRTWSRALIGAGIVLTAGSVISFGAQAGINACSILDASCRPSIGGFIAGPVLWGVGLAGVLAGSLMSKAVTPAWEARRLAAEHNARLREQLGLSN
jgi:hypothetical protein